MSLFYILPEKRGKFNEQKYLKFYFYHAILAIFTNFWEVFRKRLYIRLIEKQIHELFIFYHICALKRAPNL